MWQSEDGDFTPWLAHDENLKLLGDAIGLDLQLESAEKNVGPYRADMLCTDTVTGAWVVVENQLGPSDHCHLGQLLTYAAGLDATAVVWIARSLTPQHRAALDRLNDTTDDRLSFFGLEIELWRIGDSPPAPRFNIVSKPNNWSRGVRSARDRGLTETQQTRLAYWTAFADSLALRGGAVKPPKPNSGYYTQFGIGRLGFWREARIDMAKKRVTAQLTIADGPVGEYFRLLHSQRCSIEKEMGEPLKWDERRDGKQSYVSIHLPNADPADREQWPHQHAWLADKLEALDRVFRPVVQGLPSQTPDEETESLD